MRAVYYEQFRQPPNFTTVPDATPRPGGVVLAVRASGLCRSDWHGWQGHDPDIVLPHVPGHELAGEIVEVDAGVTRWKRGDRVTVPFVGGCGSCPQCNSGNHQVCDKQFQPGFTHWGSFAEFVAIDYADINLVRLPDAVEYTTAAVLGCRFITSFRAVVDQARVRGGEWVAVHGCGGVGLSAIMIARAMGANPIAIDVAPAKLEWAKSLGATHAIDASKVNVPEAIRDLTAGGAHVSIDALGSAATCFNSIACLRKRGRHVQVGLMTGDHAHAPVPMDRIVAHELEIYGSHGMQAHRLPEMLAMIESGALDPSRLIGKRIALDEAAGELARMDEFPGTGVTVIDRF